MKKKKLGRGLGSLIGSIEEVTKVTDEERVTELRELDIDRIERGRYQPRKHFDEQALNELAESIRVQGVVQPVVVRPVDDQFELIAGERRWRAAQIAGLQKIPAVVRELDEQSAAAIALIENIQRQDLSPLEEADALLRLINEFELTHQQVADSVGLSRAMVSNLLRLLELSYAVKDQVNRGLLDMGHARALLALPAERQEDIARVVINRGLSVRETEALVKKTLSAAPAAGGKSKSNEDPDVRRLQTRLSEQLGAEVKIKRGAKGGGQLIIRYHSSDELEGILGHLSVESP